MQAPVDYPIDDAARTAHFSMDELMYATMLDRMSAQMAPELQEFVPQPMPVFKIEPDDAIENKSIPQPLAAIAQTLLAGERANAAAGVLSRWARVNR